MDLLPAVRDLRASSLASVNNEPLIKFVVKKLPHTHTQAEFMVPAGLVQNHIRLKAIIKKYFSILYLPQLHRDNNETKKKNHMCLQKTAHSAPVYSLFKGGLNA